MSVCGHISTMNGIACKRDFGHVGPHMSTAQLARHKARHEASLAQGTRINRSPQDCNYSNSKGTICNMPAAHRGPHGVVTYSGLSSSTVLISDNSVTPPELDPRTRVHFKKPPRAGGWPDARMHRPELSVADAEDYLDQFRKSYEEVLATIGTSRINGKRVADPSEVFDRTYRFMCGLNMADHTVAEQREFLAIVKDLGSVLKPKKSNL